MVKVGGPPINPSASTLLPPDHLSWIAPQRRDTFARLRGSTRPRLGAAKATHWRSKWWSLVTSRVVNWWIIVINSWWIVIDSCLVVINLWSMIQTLSQWLDHNDYHHDCPSIGSLIVWSNNSIMDNHNISMSASQEALIIGDGDWHTIVKLPSCNALNSHNGKTYLEHCPHPKYGCSDWYFQVGHPKQTAASRWYLWRASARPACFLS